MCLMDVVLVALVMDKILHQVQGCIYQTNGFVYITLLAGRTE